MDDNPSRSLEEFWIDYLDVCATSERSGAAWRPARCVKMGIGTTGDGFDAHHRAISGFSSALPFLLISRGIS